MIGVVGTSSEMTCKPSNSLASGRLRSNKIAPKTVEANISWATARESAKRIRTSGSIFLTTSDRKNRSVGLSSTMRIDSGNEYPTNLELVASIVLSIDAMVSESRQFFGRVTIFFNSRAASVAGGERC